MRKTWTGVVVLMYVLKLDAFENSSWGRKIRYSSEKQIYIWTRVLGGYTVLNMYECT